MSSFQIQWDAPFMNAMMFLYKTRKCPAFGQNACPFGNHLCFDSHTENLRRPPEQKQFHHRLQWTYGTDKCTTGYPNTPSNCSKQHRCLKYHNSDEFRYHPLEYKMNPCQDMDFKNQKACSRGAQCWEYHSHQDRRRRNQHIPSSAKDVGLPRRQPPPTIYLNWLQHKAQQKAQQNANQNQLQSEPQYAPKSKIRQRQPPPAQPPHNYNQNQNQSNSLQIHALQVQNSQNIHRNVRNNPPPNNPRQQPNPDPPQNNRMHNDEKEEKQDNNLRSKLIQQQHTQWLQHITKWFHLFKTKPCRKADECPKGVNCMDYHGKKDRRRPIKIYQAKACPQVYDYLAARPNFRYDLECRQRDECQYAHNFYELLYHPHAYKMKQCPYWRLTRDNSNYSKNECPFWRDEDWFNQMMESKVKKVSGNIVRHHDGQHTCLDYCAFWHQNEDRRYRTDADIALDAVKKGVDDSVSSQCSSVPPPQMQPHQEPQLPHSRPLSHKSQSPPHYIPKVPNQTQAPHYKQNQAQAPHYMQNQAQGAAPIAALQVAPPHYNRNQAQAPNMASANTNTVPPHMIGNAMHMSNNNNVRNNNANKVMNAGIYGNNMNNNNNNNNYKQTEHISTERAQEISEKDEFPANDGDDW